MNENQPGPLAELAKALEGLPGYAISWPINMLIALLTDVTLTGLGLGCICLGFLISPLVALTVFFLMFAILRTVNSIANAIGMGLQHLVMSLQPAPQQPINVVAQEEPESELPQWQSPYVQHPEVGPQDNQE